MPFYPDAEFEKQEKAREIQEKVNHKKELNKINDLAKGEQGPVRGVSEKDAYNIIKATSRVNRENSKPIKISMADIKKQVAYEDFAEERKLMEIEKLLDDSETKEIRNEIIDVMAMTHTHPDKQKLFKHKLHNSNTINSYVNDNVLFRFFNKANSHIKFGTIYAIKYLQTHQEYNQYVSQCELIRRAQEIENNKRDREKADDKKQEQPKKTQEEEEAEQ